MARNKDINWNTENRSWEAITVAVLMDIRDELKQLNSTFGCHNFLGMPRTLTQIRKAVERSDKRLAKRIPIRRGK